MSQKLFVSGLSQKTTEDDLRVLFSLCGRVIRLHIVFNRRNGRSRGYGFVEMSSEGDAADAVNRLQGKPVDGCFIDVEISRPRATPITGWARDPGRQPALSRL